MKTKKKNLLLHVVLPFLLLAVAATGLYLWLFAPKGHAGLVPGESPAVVAVRPDRLPDPAAVTGLIQRWVGAVPKGIDFAQDVYLFLSPDGRFGIAAAVKDSRLLAQSLSQSADAGSAAMLKRDGGLGWAWLDAGWLIAWDENALLVMGPGTVQERTEIQHTMTQMFKAAEEKSFRRTAQWDELQEIPEGAARLFARADALPPPLSTFLRLGLPGKVRPADIQLYATLQFHPQPEGADAINLQGRLTSTEEQTRLLLQEAGGEQTLGTIYPRGIPESAICLFAAHIQEGKAADKLYADPVLRDMLLSIDGNIRTDELPTEGGYDLALCLNNLYEDGTAAFSLIGSQGETIAYSYGNAGNLDETTESALAAEARGKRIYLTLNIERAFAEPNRLGDIAAIAHTLFGERKRATFTLGATGDIAFTAK
ncbi:MAG: DUF4836 family protein [Alloprevotella sp.]|nr:DUF4836 family protein [Alloprevotella sp.]